MSIAAFLRELAARDIRIGLSGNRLLLSAGTGLLTESIRAEVAARKDEIVAFLRSASPRDAATIELQPAPRNEPLCLSFAQQRLWFLHKLEPSSPVYNLGAGFDIATPVDDVVLQESLVQLAQRHEVLRTVFLETDGVPFQVITDTLPQLRVADLRQAPAETRDEEGRRLCDEEVAYAFDLAAAPPLRALLIRLDDARSFFVLTIHHVIADGWSLGLIVKELRELYDAIQSGRQARLPELPIQYADYAYSERRRFEEIGEQAHQEYWKTKFSGTLESVDLPIDRPRDRVISSHGRTFGFTFPAEVAEGLRALGRESRVTLFTTLLTVFKALLSRYSGRSDVVVGTAVANRARVELESLIGMFVSTLVLRTDLSGDPTVREALRRVNETVLDAQEHQDYPFEKLVDLTRTERSLAHTPLFQSAFVLHNTPGGQTYQNLGSGAMFELSLYVWDIAGQLPAVVEYNTDLFDPETIERMAGHLLDPRRVRGSQSGRTDLPTRSPHTTRTDSAPRHVERHGVALRRRRLRPRAIRAPGERDSRRHRGRRAGVGGFRRDGADDLSRTRSPRQPTRSPPPEARRRSGCDSRNRSRSFGGPRRRGVRGLESRRRVCSARPRVSDGPIGFHDRRCRHRRDGDARLRSLGHSDGDVSGHRSRSRRGPAAVRVGHGPGERGRLTKSGVCDLHVGIDGATQGRAGGAPFAGEPPLLHTARARAERCRHPPVSDDALVRHRSTWSYACPSSQARVSCS